MEIGELDPLRTSGGSRESVTPKPDPRSPGEKDGEIERFITATGLRRWLARLVFSEEIRLIYDTEEKTQYSY